MHHQKETTKERASLYHYKKACLTDFLGTMYRFDLCISRGMKWSRVELQKVNRIAANKGMEVPLYKGGKNI